MKTKVLLFTIISMFMLACNNEFTENNIEHTTKVRIFGNSMSGFSGTLSRAETIRQIPENAEILFYSKGGIKADGEILTYSNSQWSGLKNDKWDVSGENAYIAAYYPVFENISDLYYPNGTIKDIVYCTTTANVGESINLSFSHIFTKMILNIENELNDTIKTININFPYKINEFDFYTGEYSVSESKDFCITFEKNYTGKYEFLIPAGLYDNIPMEITSENGKIYKSAIYNNEYKKGYEYICNIKLNNKGNGIYTKEDFIAFTQLMNGNEYNGRTLDEFYVMHNGRRVFNLFNDLTFTDEESEKIISIGMNNNGFQDIFNGNNHKLENITLHDKKYATRIGLFIETAENSIIKNLTLQNCKFASIDKSDLSSLIGKNNGIVDNCHTIDFSFPAMQTNYFFSGLVYLNYGKIINSSVSGISIDGGNGTIGVFAYENMGYILNCRINSKLNKKPGGISSSAICVRNNGNAYNIFLEDYNSTLYGITYTNDSRGQYFNCMIPEKYSKIIEIDKSNPDYIKGYTKYSDKIEAYQDITNKLNKWIENDGKEKYPDLIFRKWRTDIAGKVIFE